MCACAVANRFCEEYGVVRLSVGVALRAVLEKQPKSDLAIQIKSHLVKGLTVPDELAVLALENQLLSATCQSRGLVCHKSSLEACLFFVGFVCFYGRMCYTVQHMLMFSVCSVQLYS